MKIATRIGVGFAAALFALMIVGVVVYRNTSELIKDSGMVTHTHQVIEKLNVIVFELKDQESAVRGFSMSGQEEFLTGSVGARGRIDDALAEVTRMTIDNPRQQARLPGLRRAVTAKADAMSQQETVRRQKGLEGAAAWMATGVSRHTMEDVQRLVREMAEEERSLLAERDVRTQATAQGSLATVLWGTILSTIFVFVSAS